MLRVFEEAGCDSSVRLKSWIFKIFVVLFCFGEHVSIQYCFYLLAKDSSIGSSQGITFFWTNRYLRVSYHKRGFWRHGATWFRTRKPLFSIRRMSPDNFDNVDKRLNMASHAFRRQVERSRNRILRVRIMYPSAFRIRSPQCLEVSWVSADRVCSSVHSAAPRRTWNDQAQEKNEENIHRNIRIA